MGSLQDAVEQRLEVETEERFCEILKRKMAGAIGLYVEAVRAAEEEYGPEAREAIRRRHLERSVEANRKRGAEVLDNSLRAFCYALEAGCRGSHEWEKLEDTERRQAYRFTRCLWAEIFRELEAADIGIWICEGDGPAAAAFNPAIGFARTKTLMEGDDCCDHVYHVDGGEPAQGA
ncbi:MAG: L-2-amino-thiazoline-4-carboxylic acid hydrolase [Anaerolineae bacterium]|nr:L-2-amino-thiazoline-4-carboxylic acid hydrolase [Anaerolineae bacterium]